MGNLRHAHATVIQLPEGSRRDGEQMVQPPDPPFESARLPLQHEVGCVCGSRGRLAEVVGGQNGNRRGEIHEMSVNDVWIECCDVPEQRHGGRSGEKSPRPV